MWLTGVLITVPVVAQIPEIIVPTNSTWRYLKGAQEASNPTNAWREVGFPDANWITGSAPFHYGTNQVGGDDSEIAGTILTDMLGHYNCVFLRHEFTLGTTNLIDLQLSFLVDDGIALWINGTEVKVAGMPRDQYACDQTAFVSREIARTFEHSIPWSMLQLGSNVLAMQAWNYQVSDPDFRVDVQLTGIVSNAPPPVVVNPDAPLRGLMVTGGCCHDYANQKALLAEGISARANVNWTIVHEGGSSRDHRVGIYTNANWAANYDVVVHNECFGDVTDEAFIERIAAAHYAGVPAVMIHCSTHSYRNTQTDEWRKCVGISSYSHETRRDLGVTNLLPQHPVMKGFPQYWLDPNDELYKAEFVWPEVVPLAQAYGVETEKHHVVIWASTYGNGRVFGTTLGHANGTVEDGIFLDLITRGLLWACGKLDTASSFHIRDIQQLPHDTSLSWQSVPGWDYLIESAPEVAGPWSPVPGVWVTATNVISSLAISNLNVQHRFLRVRLLD